MTWAVEPPSVRPDNESAGYVGYYVRTNLPLVFDLVDIDGVWPAVWTYFKKSTGTFRIFEEKPHGQNELHASQWRCYTVWADLIELGIANGLITHGGVYVVWEAHRLVEPSFPIKVSKIGTHGAYANSREMSRTDFDFWLTGEAA